VKYWDTRSLPGKKWEGGVPQRTPLAGHLVVAVSAFGDSMGRVALTVFKLKEPTSKG